MFIKKKKSGYLPGFLRIQRGDGSCFEFSNSKIQRGDGSCFEFSKKVRLSTGLFVLRHIFAATFFAFFRFSHFGIMFFDRPV
jgi:hypothetical protein